MLERKRRSTVTFIHPFTLNGLDRILPPGQYQVLTDEELIEGLSFPVYRRVSTTILVPAHTLRASTIEMLTVNPSDLRALLDKDEAMPQPSIEDGGMH